MNMNSAVTRAPESVLATNKVIRNTYILLSMTLIFSGVTATISVVTGLPFGFAFGSTILAIVMLWFVLPKTANSASGIPTIFAITGLLGLGLGPMLSYYMQVHPGVVMTALGGTGAIFLTLSGYALTTRKDFSFMGGFLAIGMMVILGAMLVGLFFDIAGLQLAMSAGIIIIMSGMILYQTSAIIHGGETNYIMATASLFLAILNLFQALLHLLGAFSDD